MRCVYLYSAVVLALSPLLPDGTARGQSKVFAIAGIEAKLFYSNSGRFSANILGNPKIVLHNTPLGEGTVDGPSESTLLLVKIQGPPKAEAEGLRLRMVSTTKEDTLADREIDVGAMNTAGNFYAACWLDDAPVTVVVELTLGREVKQQRVLIPFECSE